MKRYDPVTLEVFRNLFASVAEEMGMALKRSAFSPNIKERLDFSCAVFDGTGQMVAQAAHIPVHLGSMPLSVQNAIRHGRMGPGDVVLLNDPFRGGNHLPDITAVAPVYLRGSKPPLFYVANRAHHADVGGKAPGSMPPSREIFEEGLILPPIRLVRRGRLNREIMEVILSNVRTPEEREGDLMAQLTSLKIGQRRLEELVNRYGIMELKRQAKLLLDYGERLMGKVIKGIPGGTHSFQDWLDDDGIGNSPVKIAVTIYIRGGRATVDFSGSSLQVAGNMNAVLSITHSAVFYVFRSLADSDLPENSGIMRPIKIIAPEGTVVNARPPAAVAGGTVEVSQRLVDVLLGALSKALPDRIPAASSGSMNNLAIGGIDPVSGKSFAYYETVAGGMGARPALSGIDGVHTHMTNTQNTPIEALEHDYPLMVERYKIRRGSGGRGRFRGGQGLIREVRSLCDAQVTILSDRRRIAPYGLAGGGPGKVGQNYLIDEDGRRYRLPSKVCFLLKAGQAVGMATPGGGGWGRLKKTRHCDIKVAKQK